MVRSFANRLRTWRALVTFGILDLTHFSKKCTRGNVAQQFKWIPPARTSFPWVTFSSATLQPELICRSEKSHCNRLRRGNYEILHLSFPYITNPQSVLRLILQKTIFTQVPPTKEIQNFLVVLLGTIWNWLTSRSIVPGTLAVHGKRAQA